MSVVNKIKAFINRQEFLSYLITLVLSTLLIGYAPSSIAMGVFVFFSVRYSVIHKNKIKVDITLILPILLYLLYGLTLFWSVNQSGTKIGLEKTVVLFVIPLTFGLLPKFSKKNYNIVFRYFTKINILFGLFFLIVAIVNFFKTRSLSVFTYHELVSVFNLSAIYVSLIFSISLFYLLSKKNKSTKDTILILFFLVLLLLLSSKIMMFILLIGIFVYAFCNKSINRSKIKLLIVAIAAILIIGIASILVKDRFLFEKTTMFNEILIKEKFGGVYPWTGSSIRLLQLRILKEQIEEDAIFWKGFGLFASKENVKKRHLKFNTYKTFHEYNYHNQYAQMFSEIGIFGLILLISMLIVSFIKAFKTKDFFYIMFCVVFSLMFLTESLLWRQKGLFLFIILYCIFSRTYSTDRSLDKNQRQLKTVYVKIK